jgi:hypothetical protein
MISAKWAVPALVFVAGALFGRVFGLKPLVRGGLALASYGGASQAIPPVRRVARQIARQATRRRNGSAAHRPARRRRPAAKRAHAS